MVNIFIVSFHCEYIVPKTHYALRQLILFGGFHDFLDMVLQLMPDHFDRIEVWRSVIGGGIKGQLVKEIQYTVKTVGKNETRLPHLLHWRLHPVDTALKDMRC
ncbi:hypothetical protein FKM82_019701 [Ascaphus truei]